MGIVICSLYLASEKKKKKKKLSEMQSNDALTLFARRIAPFSNVDSKYSFFIL